MAGSVANLISQLKRTTWEPRLEKVHATRPPPGTLLVPRNAALKGGLHAETLGLSHSTHIGWRGGVERGAQYWQRQWVWAPAKKGCDRPCLPAASGCVARQMTGTSRHEFIVEYDDMKYVMLKVRQPRPPTTLTCTATRTPTADRR